MMFIKLVIGKLIVNVVSAYASHVGLDEEVKKLFWEDLDEVGRGIPSTEEIFIGGDFNGHIGTTSNGFDDVHGGFSFRERNGGGVSLLEFAKAFEKEAIEVLRVSRGIFGGRQGDWWWNGEVQGKVKAKKVTYTEWLECVDEEKKNRLKDIYRKA
ncbi:uncharacterized protein LOC129894586 [Solanum dulcamara]|uniref:uncharacterized protein LOC129894586 n=1 Tax=Solanum dulcamara TaxID=45834 RepID=UPI002485D596|nr:uncharacterized protein LOC129894586 [Solanum dulcamara]